LMIGSRLRLQQRQRRKGLTMAYPSDSLSAIESSVFPELKRELAAIQDDIRSAENRVQRIPESLLSESAQQSLAKCIDKLSLAQEGCVEALKAVHSQYPNKYEL
jgi:hypothetical protein